MKVSESTVTKMLISGADGLDSISAYFEDFGAAQGKFIIECCGESWSHYWGAMWAEHNVRQFFLRCGEDYLAGKCVRNRHVPDYDKISEAIDEIVTNELELVENEDAMTEAYGEGWRMELPETESREYRYFCQIVQAVKAAIRQANPEYCAKAAA